MNPGHDEPDLRGSRRAFLAAIDEQAARVVRRAGRPRLGQVVVALFKLVTMHRHIWGTAGLWGRMDVFRQYDAENPQDES